VLTIHVPVRTRNQLNSRKHWRTDAAERRDVKQQVAYQLITVKLWPPAPTLERPWSVRLVRLGPREMDDDGVVSALKSVRDAFAAYIGVDDKKRKVVAYSYDQERSKEFGVRIEVSSA
jgi:hypothetical protein